MYLRNYWAVQLTDADVDKVMKRQRVSIPEALRKRRNEFASMFRHTISYCMGRGVRSPTALFSILKTCTSGRDSFSLEKTVDVWQSRLAKTLAVHMKPGRDDADFVVELLRKMNDANEPCAYQAQSTTFMQALVKTNECNCKCFTEFVLASAEEVGRTNIVPVLSPHHVTAGIIDLDAPVVRDTIKQCKLETGNYLTDSEQQQRGDFDLGRWFGSLGLNFSIALHPNVTLFPVRLVAENASHIGVDKYWRAVQWEENPERRNRWKQELGIREYDVAPIEHDRQKIANGGRWPAVSLILRGIIARNEVNDIDRTHAQLVALALVFGFPAGMFDFLLVGGSSRLQKRRCANALLELMRTVSNPQDQATCIVTHGMMTLLWHGLILRPNKNASPSGNCLPRPVPSTFAPLAVRDCAQTKLLTKVKPRFFVARDLGSARKSAETWLEIVQVFVDRNASQSWCRAFYEALETGAMDRKKFKETSLNILLGPQRSYVVVACGNFNAKSRVRTDIVQEPELAAFLQSM